MLERILGSEAARALTIRTAVLRAVGHIPPRAAEPVSEAERAAAILSRVNRLLGL